MTSVPFDVPINDDDIFEGDEDFMLTIDQSSLPPDVVVVGGNFATVTIMDNDRKYSTCHYSMYQFITILVRKFMSSNEYFH